MKQDGALVQGSFRDTKICSKVGKKYLLNTVLTNVPPLLWQYCE